MNYLRKLFKKNTDNYIEIISSLRERDIAIDCGANVGLITEKMIKQGAIVYAFEPNPFAFQKLEEKFKNNPSVFCFNKGVWDHEASIPLYFHELSDEDEVHWSTGSSLLDYKGNIKKDKYVIVDTVDLSKFIQNIGGKIALCKLDVEGVEVEIINKIIDTGVIHQIDLLVVETHDHKIIQLKEKTDLLRERIKKEHISNINLNWI